MILGIQYVSNNCYLLIWLDIWYLIFDLIIVICWYNWILQYSILVLTIIIWFLIFFGCSGCFYVGNWNMRVHENNWFVGSSVKREIHVQKTTSRIIWIIAGLQNWYNSYPLTIIRQLYFKGTLREQLVANFIYTLF